MKQKAKLIRKELKQNFPDTKFSVRMWGSSAINIEWCDGPESKTIDDMVGKFENYERCEITQEILSGGNSFVFTNRYTL